MERDIPTKSVAPKRASAKKTAAKPAAVTVKKTAAPKVAAKASAATGVKKPAVKKPAAPAKKPAAAKAPKIVKAAAPKKKAKASALDVLCATIVSALDENKAEEITCLSLIGKCSFADAMIVATGRSSRHVSALSEHVTDALKKTGQGIPATEGRETGDWVLMDAGDVIVHIFRPEVRQFYNLEKMWSAPAVEQ